VLRELAENEVTGEDIAVAAEGFAEASPAPARPRPRAARSRAVVLHAGQILREGLTETRDMCRPPPSPPLPPVQSGHVSSIPPY
jgi:hypothetical protein